MFFVAKVVYKLNKICKEHLNNVCNYVRFDK